MKQILLFGAGKSATVLIEYLLEQCARYGWLLVVVDAQLSLAASKINGHPSGEAVSFDILDVDSRTARIRHADVVISMLPPSLHIQVAQTCLQEGKHLLTASYIDTQLEALRPTIEEKGLLFLCEMGLDPGIDHMSAMKLLNDIKALGGKVTRFYSHCGGLVAPGNDDNPWHYKISWNPRNVVHAGKEGALFLKGGKKIQLPYADLFSERRPVEIQDQTYCWYPNRDSLHYLDIYGLPHCRDFVRTTLRHPDFIYGWKNLVDLQLTSTATFYESDGRTLASVFKEHMDRFQFSSWLEQKLKSQLEGSQELLRSLMELVELENESNRASKQEPEEMLLVDEKGDLREVDLDGLKYNAAASLAFRMHESKLTLQQLFYLGLNDDLTLVNKGRCSAAELLQFALEQKLALKPGDRDLVVMLHQIAYELDGRSYQVESSLVLEGEDDSRTAMATTVGLPLGIAAVLLLQNKLPVRGLHIPILPGIFNPVLEALEQKGICFVEQEKTL
ncbi:Saccharopine dehydrogenase NADP binding domain-containing protein [Cnuella takakiae]|uniref:Saccharopine dehydrogenase NADP binding domain-containing protein n=1 Tax=Cnuella takakiae TaxID=1302690 RepID=A0A1M4V645_9BACT|nr:saccharopine dehydrogenase C-terminal domain-containing protein [Cnuella takakiae]OLY92694.1 hypothetical protein BUE76_12960 [Cnuella takakiae]SHE64461.1 Saccharopine dehydrogenase NADP binding domain-containing protein [Cnuella takakiae]